MVLLDLIGLLVLFGIFMVGYTLGRSRASEYDKIKKAEYKEMSGQYAALKYNNKVYKEALKNISDGTALVPEITASIALKEIKEN